MSKTPTRTCPSFLPQRTSCNLLAFCFFAIRVCTLPFEYGLSFMKQQNSGGFRESQYTNNPSFHSSHESCQRLPHCSRVESYRCLLDPLFSFHFQANPVGPSTPVTMTVQPQPINPAYQPQRSTLHISHSPWTPRQAASLRTECTSPSPTLFRRIPCTRELRVGLLPSLLSCRMRPTDPWSGRQWREMRSSIDSNLNCLFVWRWIILVLCILDVVAVLPSSRVAHFRRELLHFGPRLHYLRLRVRVHLQLPSHRHRSCISSL